MSSPLFKIFIKSREVASFNEDDILVADYNNKIKEEVKRLLNLCQSGCEILKNLSVDNNEIIALAASTWLLACDERQAKNQLRVLIESENAEVSISADVTLSEWQAGRLPHVRELAN